MKQDRVDLDAPRPGGTREAEREAQALPFGQHLDRLPLQRCRLAVGNDPQSFGNDREQLVGPFARSTRLEQRLRIFNAELVRRVEVVNDERAARALRVEMHIEITERGRVGASFVPNRTERQ
jgi:hypothetical protein